jgi:hypothetical protein
MPMTSDATAIATLNDEFRRTLIGGHLMTTQGVLALGPAAVALIVAKVRQYSAFGPDNDPHGEHDFGSVEHDGTRLYWKIDYYDLSMTAGAEDPADPTTTRRVLTVMLAAEY